MASGEVKKLLEKHPSLSYITEKEKVICSLSKHEMPATVAAIESYVKGKKYQKLAQQKAYNYDQHKPHIIPSNKKKHLHELFCTLTLRHIQKIPQDVERHVTGRKYKNALAKWKKCQETGEKFIPRAGGRKARQDVGSDSDAFGDGDSFLADGDDSDKQDFSDDMSDLYPPEDFPVDGCDELEEDDKVEDVKSQQKLKKPKKKVITKASSVKEINGISPADKTGNSSDSDSDYDLSVMDSSTAQAKSGEIDSEKEKRDGSVSSQSKKKGKKIMAPNSSNLAKSQSQSEHQLSMNGAVKGKKKNKKRKIDGAQSELSSKNNGKKRK